MCFSQKNNAVTPGAAPAPALPSATSADIGTTRKKANMETFGDKRGPNYRVDRSKAPSMTNTSNSIKM